MIIDALRNAAQYHGLGRGLRMALDYLAETDFSTVEPGRYELDGDRVYALVQRYDTKPRGTGVWEAHQHYIDVQYVADGAETMGYANVAGLTVTQPYLAGKDCVLLAGEGSFLAAPAGTFVVFFPEDAHMPCLADGKPQPVCKVVVKVAVEALP
ncbi:MAG: Toxin-antitoxin biofilm protein TabA [Lentisphaerae bacterium ADurb.BinA184]|nr:MAG: Toxin-antitoxin biofilm protein TabA [Lentisphaerae bacterium ADurb.BinA184]